MKDIIFIGDGLGVRTLPAKLFGMNVIGTDISDYAINHSYCKENMIKDDITDTKLTEHAKLVVVYDVLEHIQYNKLDITLKNIKNLIEINGHILISVPYKDSPNCENDKTHIIKESKEWWHNKFKEAGFVIESTPSHFLYAEQMTILRRIE